MIFENKNLFSDLFSNNYSRLAKILNISILFLTFFLASTRGKTKIKPVENAIYACENALVTLFVPGNIAQKGVVKKWLIFDTKNSKLEH